MTIQIELPEDQAAALTARAAEEGLSLEEWFKRIATIESGPPQEFANGKERARAFLEWVDSFPDTPPLSDEAISRESMYPDRW
jgi:hypothetical protein